MKRRLAPWCLIAAGILVVEAGLAGQVFRLAVDGVAVDVRVTSGGRPVPDLTAADFTLRDNGVEQRIQSVMLEDVPITLLFVLDTSESVHGELLDALKHAARGAATALRDDDALGLVAFTGQVRVPVPPPAAPETLLGPLEELEAGGATALYDATFAALALRAGISGRLVVLVFSDGDDTVSWLDPRDVLAAARRTDIVFYAVVSEHLGPDSLSTTIQSDPTLRANPRLALRRRRDERRLFDTHPELFGRAYLPRLVEETGGSLFAATSSELEDAFIRVVNEFRSRYVLTYVPEGVAPDGWHEIAVNVRGRRADVQARRGYLR